MRILIVLLTVFLSTCGFSASTEDPMEKIKSYQNNTKNLWLKDYGVFGTIDKDGYPKQRMMRIADITKEGFIFYADGDSNKVKEFSNNNHVSMQFIFSEDKNVIAINATGHIKFLGLKRSKHFRPEHDQKYSGYIFIPISIKFTFADSLKRENKFFTHQHVLFQLKNGQWEEKTWMETLTKYEKE